MKYNFWFPWPLNNRECLLEFSTYPVPEEQGVLLLMRSPKENYLGTDLPQIDNQTVRMTVPIGCLYIRYIFPKLTQVTILVKANASIIPSELLPDWLLNFGKKQIMYFLVDSLRHCVMNFYGSEYENRVKNKPEFYNFLKEFLIKDVHIS